jgi:LPXTG-motif cell wall-anchored protein
MRSPLPILTAITAAAISSPALAQTTAPAPATGSTGGGSWLWAVLVLALIAAAAWYFLSRRSLTSRTTGVSHDRVAGSAEQMKGSLKEGVGSLIGDTKLQAEGRADKVEGKVQNTHGGAKDTLRGQ